MDLSLLKKFFDTAGQVQGHLRKQWANFRQQNAFALYKAIALKSQPQINMQMLRQFIVSFNWEVSFITCNEAHPNANFEIKSLVPNMSSEKILDFGIELLLKHWGKDGILDFPMFCQLVKGEQDNPDARQKQISFQSKKNLFQLLIGEVNGLLKIEALKKAVFHEYKNKTDLFQMLTPASLFDLEGLNMLMLSFSDRKSKQQIHDISKRAKLPWDFNQFLNTFKSAASKNNEKQYKIHYSSKRNKGDMTPNDKAAYTTPRKSKAIYGQTSTKLTKGGDVLADLVQSSREVSEFSFRSEGRSKTDKYVDILCDILQLEQDFIKESATLIKREDFDLELVYERHGKKFQKILNDRYGICNFSAFVRFIVPRDFDHRYLSFIRYQANNTLSSTTEQMIQDLLISHEKKQNKIQQLWGECDLQLFQRAFCQPRQANMKTGKLRDYFTNRETTILADRLDPCKKGFISIGDLR